VEHAAMSPVLGGRGLAPLLLAPIVDDLLA
jgi:hypothetical protein